MALFNLGKGNLTNGHRENTFFEPSQKRTLQTNWKTFEEQGLNKQSISDVFAGSIPAIRQKEFLSQEECWKMVEVLKSHKICDQGTYDIDHVWPRVGCWHSSDRSQKETYFSGVKNAYSLQDRWKKELGIDIMERSAHSLREASGMVVRLAREGERDYFAVVILAINTGIQIHADYAPFEGNGWEIGRVAAQMSWNILLNPVPGADTFIYDRQWQAPQDDLPWRKDFPMYAYDPCIVDGHVLKVLRAGATHTLHRELIRRLPAGSGGEANTLLLWT
ncbi:hypothetical protein DL771_004155 [Monosporascus sp. 5C6A]|nr:hypothetical protein DL771_004155 [Monosporascus sp. 5C6A]